MYIPTHKTTARILLTLPCFFVKLLYTDIEVFLIFIKCPFFFAGGYLQNAVKVQNMDRYPFAWERDTGSIVFYALYSCT